VTVEPLHPRRPPPAPRLTLLAVGYRAPAGLAGPPALAEGRAPEIGRQVALDRAAAFRLGVRLNDTVQVGKLRLRVVGLTRGTNLIATQFLFLPLGTARRTQHLSGSASFVAVHVAAGADPMVVARAIEARDTTLAVFSRKQFIANNLREATAGIVPVLALLAGLGVAVAGVLVVLLIQGLVEERRGEIAVCFALGSGVPHVGEALMARALLLVMAGAAGGTMLAYLLQQVLDRVLPTVELVFGVWDQVAVFGIFSVAGILAAGIPVLRLGRVDPLEAFRP
jgi:ABC-type lipoprotein release transport system permease subunit